MSWAPRRGDESPDLPGRTLHLILDLDLGETAHGTVGPVDGSRVGFHGWIGLMSAINDLCSEAGQAPPHVEHGAVDDLP